MMKNNDPKNYNLYYKFLETYSPVGFRGIKRGDPLMVELEQMTEANDQFFYIADIIRLEILFTSNRSVQMVGVEPERLSTYYFMDATHPDDLHRFNLGRSRLIKTAQELFIEGRGISFVSTDYRVQNAVGGYTNLLLQCYLFYTEIPYKTVFFLKVHTNIDWYKKHHYGYHHFTSDDLNYFRYPDEEILQKGNIYSVREFEIIQMIEKGLNSEKIAEKLFLSVHTVNTHRRNILIKSGKTTMTELIHELAVQGLL
jgi:DNA-binding CsgD family transcriptional regulator